jgi:hypothetical protein
MFGKPFSPLAFLTRVPFWYIAGGIGYVIGVVVGKKIGWLVAYEIPIKEVFDFGARFGCVTQLVFQLYRSLRAELSRTSTDEKRIQRNIGT